LRPGDVTISSWWDGRSAAFDFTVVSPFAVAVLALAADRRGSAARHAEDDKDNTYLQLCRQQNLEFVPMAVETCGGWGEAALAAFSRLSVMLAAVSGRTPSEELRWMHQRHAVALQRDNARMMLQRAPEFVPL